MKSIIAWSFIALALGGCASEATWNTSTFPEQPQYELSGAAPTVAEPKK